MELVRHFLVLHGKKGDVVCDPFARSGTTCVAAKSLGMRYIACELNPHWHAVARRRIAEMDGPPGARSAHAAVRQRREHTRKVSGYTAAHGRGRNRA